MKSIATFLSSPHPTAFSFEMLPPLRGGSIEKTFSNLRPLLDLKPAYVNITTHRNEVTYHDQGGGTFRVVHARRRPGTVAIAAVLRERFGVRPVPHLICGDFSRQQIEDQLIDLSYLGINDVLVLRGDRERSSATFTSSPDGHPHAAGLARQIREFNLGLMADGTRTEPTCPPFSFGVAGYPEKHEEAMNLHSDIAHLKAKVDAGAEYIVTQMFFDNEKYFNFVKLCRAEGIGVPIVPGIKPLTALRQMSLLPRVFHIDIPRELSIELSRCKDDAAVRELGIEWGVAQAKELKAAGVPSIHFYAMHATQSVEKIARQIY